MKLSRQMQLAKKGTDEEVNVIPLPQTPLFNFRANYPKRESGRFPKQGGLTSQFRTWRCKPILVCGMRAAVPSGTILNHRTTHSC